tara:strand:+ start:819 stop:1151 length:333 start_codon:yes stop_codon:yes gene_type:complete
MNPTDDYTAFLCWLKPEVNSLAAWCSGFVAAHEEAPPENISLKLQLLRGCWDAWQFLVEHDTRYLIRHPDLYSQDVDGFREYVEEELKPFYSKHAPDSWDDMMSRYPGVV